MHWGLNKNAQQSCNSLKYKKKNIVLIGYLVNRKIKWNLLKLNRLMFLSWVTVCLLSFSVVISPCNCNRCFFNLWSLPGEIEVVWFPSGEEKIINKIWSHYYIASPITCLYAFQVNAGMAMKSTEEKTTTITVIVLETVVMTVFVIPSSLPHFSERVLHIRHYSVCLNNFIDI